MSNAGISHDLLILQPQSRPLLALLMQIDSTASTTELTPTSANLFFFFLLTTDTTSVFFLSDIQATFIWYLMSCLIQIKMFPSDFSVHSGVTIIGI